MATGPRYAVRYRRRREGRTNYRKRLALLKSGKPRLVVRKSNQYIICHIVQYKSKGDTTAASFSTKQLKNLGWTHDCKTIPAAYLAGIGLAATAKKAKIKEAIADLGMYTLTKGSRIYAAVKGVKDGGLNIAFDDSVAPSEDRLQGKHLKPAVQKDLAAIRKKLGV